jgi:uncharacterized membrane protein
VLVEPVPLPGGIADLLDFTNRRFPEGTEPPYSLSSKEFRDLSELKLQRDRPRVVQPNPIAVLHPVSYLPQVPAIALAIAAGLPPLVVFYLGRLAGLFAGIALTFFAIRIMPARRYSLAAIALMPPVLFSRSTLDADQFTNGLAFLFVALAVREIAAVGAISKRSVTALAAVAFLLAQAKSAYLLLPLLGLAIPAARFGSARAKMLACAVIALPGIAASVGWMLLLKQTYFTSLTYGTWSGIVDPHRQLAFVLAHPVSYAGIVVRTLFGTMFLPRVIVEFLASFGPPVQLPFAMIALIAVILPATVMADDQPMPVPLKSWWTRGLALGLSVVTVLIILTLLYLQWTRLGGRVIDGFNGRYFYPVAPLLLLAIPAGRKKPFPLPPAAMVLLLGIVSVASTCWTTWQTYFG